MGTSSSFSDPSPSSSEVSERREDLLGGASSSSSEDDSCFFRLEVFLCFFVGASLLVDLVLFFDAAPRDGMFR